MIRRLGKWLVRMILSCDKLLCVWLRGWGFVWLNWGELPETDESISGWIGRRAEQGAKWALIAQSIVNFIMRNPDHCRDAVIHDGAD